MLHARVWSSSVRLGMYVQVTDIIDHHTQLTLVGAIPGMEPGGGYVAGEGRGPGSRTEGGT